MVVVFNKALGSPTHRTNMLGRVFAPQLGSQKVMKDISV